MNALTTSLGTDTRFDYTIARPLASASITKDEFYAAIERMTDALDALEAAIVRLERQRG